MKEELHVKVYFAEPTATTRPQEINAVRFKLDSRHRWSKNVDFVSKEQALEQMRKRSPRPRHEPCRRTRCPTSFERDADEGASTRS